MTFYEDETMNKTVMNVGFAIIAELLIEGIGQPPGGENRIFVGIESYDNVSSMNHNNHNGAGTKFPRTPSQ